MTGYTPLLTSDDTQRLETDPDGRPINPETGEVLSDEEIERRKQAAHSGINNLYGFSTEQSETTINGSTTTEGIVDSLGADGAKIGTSAEVRTAAASLNVGGDSQLAKEVSHQTARIDSTLESIGGQEKVGQREIRNRLAATALEGFATGKTDGDPGVFTHDMMQSAERAAVASALAEDPDAVKNDELRLWAKQTAASAGGAEHASNEQLVELGRQAENVGVTLDTVEEAIVPVEEKEADKKPEEGLEKNEPEPVAEQAAEKTAEPEAEQKSSTDVASEKLVAGDIESAVAALAQGDTNKLLLARELVTRLSKQQNLEQALQGQLDPNVLRSGIEAVQRHLEAAQTTPKNKTDYTLAA